MLHVLDREAMSLAVLHMYSLVKLLILVIFLHHVRYHPLTRRGRSAITVPRLSLTARHLGLDPELYGFWSHWLIEDLQELTEGWWDFISIYAGWVSTKEFVDTGECTGFITSTLPESGSKEDEALSCDLSDDEDEDEGAADRENILKNAVLGMTQSARYFLLHLLFAMRRPRCF